MIPTVKLCKRYASIKFCYDHSIDNLDLLKLDVQGHEHSALKGAEHLIRAGHVGNDLYGAKLDQKCGSSMYGYQVH